MARRGDSLDFSEGAKAPWNYTSGFFAHALLELGQCRNEPNFTAFGSKIVSSCILQDGTIRGYDRDEMNLDMITPGRAVLDLYRRTGEPRLKQAAIVLRRQLAEQPRTYDGGFWHKKIYPDQMWLDGLYMAGPFLCRVRADLRRSARDRGRGEADPAHQPASLRPGDRALLPRLGLEAGPAVGQSCDWGRRQTSGARSVGWYGMACVDILDALPPEKRSHRVL